MKKKRIHIPLCPLRVHDLYTGIEAYYFTHNGGIRQNNEDSLLIQEILINSISMENSESFRMDFQDAVFSVADGIGGEQKGEVASRIVLETLRDNKAELNGESSIPDVLNQAKNHLDKYAIDNPDAFNLGTTLAGIAIMGESVIIFNAGDCRVYRINGNDFEQVTRDHSVVQALFEEGAISEDEMRFHPRRNVVTSSVSGDGIADSLHVHTNELSLRENDQFFICCDGIWGCFSHNELEMIYQRFPGPEYCGKILGAAIARKASDNISAILIRIT